MNRRPGVLDDMNDDLEKMLEMNSEYIEDVRLEEDMIKDEMNNIRQFLILHNYPAISNVLPNCSLNDSRKTLTVISKLISVSKEAIEMRTKLREGVNRAESKNTILEQESEKLKEKYEQLNKRLIETNNKLKSSESVFKGESDILKSEIETLKKANLKLQHQASQYAHEIKKKENENEKLKEKIHKKIFDKDMNVRNTIEMTKPIYMSGPLVYVNKSGENEFTYMVTKANEEIQSNLKTENEDLRD